MKEKIDYKEVPQDYLHCLNTECLRSSDCLRFKAGLLTDETVHYFRVINPLYASGEKECGYFHPLRLIRYATGIKNMFVNLPYNKAVKLKKIVRDYFGHSVYYRIYNKERLLNTKEQAFIREAFMKEGIEAEPVYEEYIEKYEFFSTGK